MLLRPWNDVPPPEDIDIRIETFDAPPFVQSFFGQGFLTFYQGYQLKTEGDRVLWVRGPLNLPKDGLYPLKSLVDAAVLPCIHWQCTRPSRTIRFAADEPFSTLLLCPKSTPENLTLDVVQPDANADLDDCELAFQELAESAAVRNVFRRMGAIDMRRQQRIHS